MLSNIQTEARFERLTRRDWRQVRRPSPGNRDRARDGKLKFGTVSGAVLAVLAEARSPLRYIEIHARVCELLIDTPIQKGSVKAFLSAEATRRRPRFIRVERGLYHLASGNRTPACPSVQECRLNAVSRGPVRKALGSGRARLLRDVTPTRP